MVKKFYSFSKNLTTVIDKVGQKSKLEEKSQTKTDTPVDRKKVLMFGWELPPFNSGGLGVACFEMAKSLAHKDTDITFVLPKKQELNIPFMKVAFADGPGDGQKSWLNNFKIEGIDTIITPYMTEEMYIEAFGNFLSETGMKMHYGKNMMDEVFRYGVEAANVAKRENFDVIHAHDWLSYPAGIMAKKVSKKPLIAHVHALEYDRSREDSVNRAICEIEKRGLQSADKVIAISHYVKDRVMHYYDVPAHKIEVVHNGITFTPEKKPKYSLKDLKANGQKIVLFVGRITYQKGVDHLIHAAKKVLEINPKTIFMIVGSGDMSHHVIEQAAHMGISDKVLFTGFLRGKELEKVYQASDVFVMPSVSEPFGLVALEALTNEVPVILSKQSGASEVVKHALKVDFWDQNELANQIIAILNNKSLQSSLRKNGYKEVQKCSWDVAADKLVKIYSNLPSVS